MVVNKRTTQLPFTNVIVSNLLRDTSSTQSIHKLLAIHKMLNLQIVSTVQQPIVLDRPKIHPAAKIGRPRRVQR